MLPRCFSIPLWLPHSCCTQDWAEEMKNRQGTEQGLRKPWCGEYCFCPIPTHCPTERALPDCQGKGCVLLLHPHSKRGGKWLLSVRWTRPCVPLAVKCLFNCYTELLEWSKATLRLLSTWPTVFSDLVLSPLQYHCSFTLYFFRSPWTVSALLMIYFMWFPPIYLRTQILIGFFISKVCKALERTCQRYAALERKACYSSYKSVTQACTIPLRMNRTFKLSKSAWLPFWYKPPESKNLCGSTDCFSTDPNIPINALISAYNLKQFYAEFLTVNYYIPASSTRSSNFLLNLDQGWFKGVDTKVTHVQEQGHAYPLSYNALKSLPVIFPCVCAQLC